MKNWWQNFFKPITSEVMFKPRQGEQAQKEVAEVLRHIGDQKKLKILDLCCGEGRHSILFAKQGHDVVGLDYTNNFLTTARKKVKNQKLSIRFVKGDMKNASHVVEKNNFDLVVSLYNSFGYFDKKVDDLKTLREVHKVLKIGGYFIINTLNGDGVRARLNKPVSTGYEISKNLFMIDKAHLDLKKMRTESHWTIIDVRKKKSSIFRGSFSQNVYLHKEMRAMLNKSGFKVIKTWGLLQGGVFDEKNSWHQTLMVQKVK